MAGNKIHGFFRTCQWEEGNLFLYPQSRRLRLSTPAPLANTWNSVPSYVASANMLNCFKSRLYKQRLTLDDLHCALCCKSFLWLYFVMIVMQINSYCCYCLSNYSWYRKNRPLSQTVTTEVYNRLRITLGKNVGNAFRQITTITRT